MHSSISLYAAACVQEKRENLWHCRLWMDKQEAAFAAWLNSMLVPASSAEEGAASQALAARRLTAKVRGLLWHLYSADKDIISSTLR